MGFVSVDQFIARLWRLPSFQDRIPGLRAQYLHDSEFHAFVEVLCQERYWQLYDELNRLRQIVSTHRR
jgi:hypothetical protein